MELLLIRHGEAVEDASDLGDAGRWLTAKGRKLSRRVGEWLAEKKERRPAKIWTSPLVRSVQTAEILAEKAGLEGDVYARAELSPGRDAAAVLDLLVRFQPDRPLALVGHEPMLSALAHALLPAVTFPGMKKSGVLAVSWDGKGPATLRFLLIPKGLELVTELPAAAPR